MAVDIHAAINLPDGVDCVLHDTLDSTNEEAKRMAAEDVAGPVWVMARRQTAGRGRLGRSWVSSPGNLHASLLIRPQTDPIAFMQLSFVAALAAYDALAGLASASTARKLALKWPNDVLLDKAKIAGILLEASALQRATAAAPWLVIGIGINLVSHPEEAHYPVTDLLTITGQRQSCEKTLERLAAAFERHYTKWRNGHGVESILELWTARASGLGQSLSVNLPGKKLTGTFLGLNELGGLLLRQPSGEITTITAGDVFLGGRNRNYGLGIGLG